MGTLSTNEPGKRCDICGKTFPAEELISASLIHGGVAEEISSTKAHWSMKSHICHRDLQRFRHKYLATTMARENSELSELQRELLQNIAENESVIKNINDEFQKKLSFGDQIADKVASFGGSWNFIIIFMSAIIIWIIINSVVLLLAKPFDPFPFILLNLVLSCVAAVQAPVIMMSQNRQEAKDRIRSEEDFRTNLKAELEIRTLSAKIDELITHQWQRMMEIQQMQIEMMEEISGISQGKKAQE